MLFWVCWCIAVACGVVLAWVLLICGVIVYWFLGMGYGIVGFALSGMFCLWFVGYAFVWCFLGLVIVTVGIAVNSVACLFVL